MGSLSKLKNKEAAAPCPALEPRGAPAGGGVVSLESATGNGLRPPTAPLLLNLRRRRRRPSSQSENLYQGASTITL